MASTSEDLLTRFKRQLTGRISFAKKDMLPTVVYHYTIASGFEGILRESTIRATNLTYMNDRSELEYGRRVVERTLHREINTSAGNLRVLLKSAADALDEVTLAEVYVACFTLLKDNLGQWRAYGAATGERYSIGFNTGILQDATFAAADAHLMKVSYSASTQVKRIRTILTRAAEFISTQHISRKSLHPFAVETARRLARLIPALKTHEYSIEKEWRVVITRPSVDAAEISFDTSRGVVRPYFPFKLLLNDDDAILSLDVLAPSGAPAAIKAANLVLRRAKIGSVNAKASRVPFAE
jgi:DUF2971 family protein